MSVDTKNNQEERRIQRVVKAMETISELAEQARSIKVHAKPDVTEYKQVVRDYLVQTGRKIYGGLAIHFALIAKNMPEIYTTMDNVDYDFYSPDPMGDVTALTNLLISRGCGKVHIKSAQHEGTIKLVIHHQEVADITYCWSHHYYKIPHGKSECGLQYVMPEFQIIDTYKIFVDPLFWYKVEQNIVRAHLLEKAYLVRPNPPLRQSFDNSKNTSLVDPESKLRTRFNDLLVALKSRNDLALVDTFAYNIYIEESGVPHWKERMVEHLCHTAYTRYPHKVMLEIITECAINDYEIIVSRALLEKFGENYQLLIDGIPLLHLYGDDFCFPFKTFQTFNIGSYHLVLRMLFIMKFMHNRTSPNLYRKTQFMINHLYQARRYYLRKNRLIGTEDTLFQELQVDCIGTGFPDKRTEHFEKKHKLLRVTVTAPISINFFKTYRYPNSSGRPYKMIDKEGNTTYIKLTKDAMLPEPEMDAADADLVKDDESPIEDDIIQPVSAKMLTPPSRGLSSLKRKAIKPKLDLYLHSSPKKSFPINDMKKLK